MHAINTTFFDVHDRGRAFSVSLKPEFMKPSIPGREERYFRVGMLNDGRIVINQNNAPQNPILSAPMFIELTQIIQQLESIRRARQGLFPLHLVIDTGTGRVCGSYIHEDNARRHQAEQPDTLSVVPAPQPDPETGTYSAGYMYGSVVKTDADYEDAHA